MRFYWMEHILISCAFFMAISSSHDVQVPSPTIWCWYESGATSPPRVAKIFWRASKVWVKVMICHNKSCDNDEDGHEWELSKIEKNNNNKLMHERTPSSIEHTHARTTHVSKFISVVMKSVRHAVHCVCAYECHLNGEFLGAIVMARRK